MLVPGVTISCLSPPRGQTSASISRMHTCGTCKRALPLDQFANRQRKNVRAGRGGTCSSCATGRTQADAEQANAKEVEVAHHFYEESRGQVDGMNRKVKNGYISLMAQRPTSADMEESAV